MFTLQAGNKSDDSSTRQTEHAVVCGGQDNEKTAGLMVNN